MIWEVQKGISITFFWPIYLTWLGAAAFCKFRILIKMTESDQVKWGQSNLSHPIWGFLIYLYGTSSLARDQILHLVGKNHDQTYEQQQRRFLVSESFYTFNWAMSFPDYRIWCSKIAMAFKKVHIYRKTLGRPFQYNISKSIWPDLP